MPVPPHNRLTFSGVFGSTQSPAEIWSFRLCTLPSEFSSQTELEQAAVSARLAFETHLAPVLSGQVKLTRTRVSQHQVGGVTGQTSEGGYRQADDLEVIGGARPVTNLAPLQTALVVSLTTPRAGSAGRGRFYLPVIDMPPQAGSFVVADTNVTAVANAAKGFVNNLNAILNDFPGDGDVAVVSSKGFATKVTGVRVGNVLDTQRSRRNALPEAYTERSLL